MATAAAAEKVNIPALLAIIGGANKKNLWSCARLNEVLEYLQAK